MLKRKAGDFLNGGVEKSINIPPGTQTGYNNKYLLKNILEYTLHGWNEYEMHGDCSGLLVKVFSTPWHPGAT
jgi:hypothetical protein